MTGVPQVEAILLKIRKTNLCEASPSSRDHSGAELVNLEIAAKEHLGLALSTEVTVKECMGQLLQYTFTGRFCAGPREAENFKKNPRRQVLGTPLGEPLPGDSAQILEAGTPSRKPQTTVWQQDNTVMETPAGTYPAEALDTDIAGVLATWGPVHHSVLELVVGCARRHPAEQLAPVLQQN